MAKHNKDVVCTDVYLEYRKLNAFGALIQFHVFTRTYTCTRQRSSRELAKKYLDILQETLQGPNVKIKSKLWTYILKQQQ